MHQRLINILGVPEHFNLPWKLAAESGAFEAAGLHVRYQDEPGGTGAMTKALREGRADMAILLTEGIVADILHGNPSKIVSTYVQSPLIWGIHVPANSGIQSIEDIRSYPYAISRFGSGSHLMAIVDAWYRGWDPSSLSFVRVGNLNGARESLGNGSSSVFFWERFMTQPYVDNGEFRRIGERLTPWPCFMLAATNELIEQRSDDIRTIIQVIHAQIKSLLDDLALGSLISDRYSLEPSQVNTWLSKTVWNASPHPDPNILTSVIPSLQQAGLIQASSVNHHEIFHFLP